MVTVGAITLLVKIVGFFKESVIASSYGISIFLDTYFIAILVPTFIQNVFIGALKNLFIPNYIRELSSSKDVGNIQSVTLLLITLLAVVLSIVSIVFIHNIDLLFPDHDASFYTLISTQFYIVLPCIFLWGYASYLNGLLEIKKKFFASTVASFFLPITTILFIFFLKTSFGDKTLAYSMTIGSFIALIYLFLVCLKEKVIQVSKPKVTENTGLMLRQYPPKLVAGLLIGINPFVDQFFAAKLTAGSIAALNYGTKIPAFLISILLVALGNVLLPHFSTLVTQDPTKAKKQLFKIIKTIFWASSLIAIVTIFFSSDIVRILFERNAFTSNHTLITYKIQQISIVYVPFYLMTIVCIKYLTALNKNVFMAWVSFGNLILNVIFNMILIKYYEVYGVVIGTSILRILTFMVYLTYIKKYHTNTITK